MRVEGNIAFTGVLRVQGDVVGDVACRDDSGTIVVDGTGSVTGVLDAPHIAVRGRVFGPLHSSQSIVVQQGACVVGDAFYREIDIHEGGVVEGSLTPTTRTETEPRPERRVAGAAGDDGAPSAQGRSRVARPGAGRAVAVALMLIVAVGAAVWLSRTAPAPRAADAGPAAESPAKETLKAQPAAATGDSRQDATTPAVAPPVSGPNADGQESVQASPQTQPAGEPEAVAIVQGVNSAKPAGVFLLVAKEPAVLLKKKRQDGGAGKRIEVSRGRTISIAIGKGEVFRVAEGRDLEIFFQGRKVASKIIENGTWMSFVPQAP